MTAGRGLGSARGLARGGLRVRPRLGFGRASSSRGRRSLTHEVLHHLRHREVVVVVPPERPEGGGFRGTDRPVGGDTEAVRTLLARETGLDVARRIAAGRETVDAHHPRRHHAREARTAVRPEDATRQIGMCDFLTVVG